MTDREYFERHLDTMIVSESGLAHAIVRDADDDYKTAWVNQQWVTWQAALACRLVPESVVVPPARKWVGLTDSDINNKHSKLWRVCIEDAVKAEREACAKLLEGGSFLHDQSPAKLLADEAAKAIRARGSV